MSSRQITRREFAVAAAAIAASPGLLRGTPAPNDRIRVGVIGCRNRGHQVAANLANSGRFQIVTLCDCDSAMIDTAMTRLKDLPVAPSVAKDFRRLLDDKTLDAVVNATPDHWHALITALALDAGKHVYVEKPASHSIDDGKAMVEAQRRHPKQVVLVGTQQRSGQHFKDAKAFVASGALGKVAFARAWIMLDRGSLPVVPDSKPPASLDYDMWLGPAPKRPYNEKKLHYNWHFMKDYGTGDMGNWGAHWLDTIRWMLDLDVPKSVTALGGKYVHQDAREFPDTQTVLYEFPNLTVLWELRQWATSVINGSANGAEIAGDKGMLIISRGGWSFSPKGGKQEKHPGTEIEIVHALNFAEAIAGQARPAADIVEGHKSAIMIHLGNTSAALNRRLEFDPAAQTVRNDPEADKLQGREYRAPWRLPA
jgi:predicted dehydrogenase